MNDHSTHELMQAIGAQARRASARMATASARDKALALQTLADLLRQQAPALLEANEQDVQRARGNGLAGPLLDRLTLNEKITATAAQGCEQLG